MAEDHTSARLTGDDGQHDAWRRQVDAVIGHARIENGQTLGPHMHGDQGWYDYRPTRSEHGVLELDYWSMRADDRRRVPSSAWLAFLNGQAPSYPERALRDDFETIRLKVAAMRRDRTTPDTRLADDPMAFNPATVGNLVRLMLGGPSLKYQGEVLHARVRYIDPARRRPGLPEDVAALVDSLEPASTSIILVNLNPSEPRSLIVQGGGYGEHVCDRSRREGGRSPCTGPRSA